MDTTQLDRMLPLQNASHADVEQYGVDIPLRYSECFAKLRDGRIVRLRDARQFKGWVGMNGSRRLLFANGHGSIELKRAPQRGFIVSSAQEGCQYVARDGSLATLQTTDTEAGSP